MGEERKLAKQKQRERRGREREKKSLQITNPKHARFNWYLCIADIIWGIKDEFSSSCAVRAVPLITVAIEDREPNDQSLDLQFAKLWKDFSQRFFEAEHVR
jgi:hypothetical protein